MGPVDFLLHTWVFQFGSLIFAWKRTSAASLRLYCVYVYIYIYVARRRRRRVDKTWDRQTIYAGCLPWLTFFFYIYTYIFSSIRGLNFLYNIPNKLHFIEAPNQFSSIKDEELFLKARYICMYVPLSLMILYVLCSMLENLFMYIYM